MLEPVVLLWNHREIAILEWSSPSVVFDLQNIDRMNSRDKQTQHTQKKPIVHKKDKADLSVVIDVAPRDCNL